jgi:hypothetical protein
LEEHASADPPTIIAVGGLIAVGYAVKHPGSRAVLESAPGDEVTMEVPTCLAAPRSVV